MNNMVVNELYNKIIDLDLSEYTHQKLYDLCFKLDDEIEESRALYESEREVKEDYKSKVNKAIEELEIWRPKEKILQEEKEYLLDILKGVDK